MLSLFVVRREILVVNIWIQKAILLLKIELEKVVLVMHAKSVISNMTRVFEVANNLHPVRKILKRLCKSSLLNLFST